MFHGSLIFVRIFLYCIDIVALIEVIARASVEMF